MRRFRSLPFFPVLLSAFISWACLLGCREQPQVTHEIVPKHDSIQLHGDHPQSATTPKKPSGEPTHRMLAAIIRRDEKAWFLKGVARVDQYGDGLRDQFAELVKSIAFTSESAQPSWQLSEGWRHESGSGMRFATLYAGEVEFSVIPLPVPDGDERQYLLSNIVRWRGQLQLPPISLSQLSDDTQQIELDDGRPATWVDLRGWQGADEMGSLFSDGHHNLPPDHPPIGSSFGSSFQPEAASGLVYEIPDGWQEARSQGLRRAAFQVTEGDQRIEITVIDLAGTAGDLLANVNRWRNQVGLGPVASVAAIDAATITVDGRPATYLRIEGTDGRAIWATVVPDQGRVWFVKLTGDVQLAEREEPAFRSWIESMRFGG